MPEIAVRLNQIHGVNHSVRYWRILIGPWLGFFIQALFDRWTMLKHAIMKYDIDHTVLITVDRRLSQIIERTKEIIDQCAVSFPEYGDVDRTTKQLFSPRECLVGYSMIEPCVERARKSTGTMKGFLEKVKIS